MARFACARRGGRRDEQRDCNCRKGKAHDSSFAREHEPIVPTTRRAPQEVSRVHAMIHDFYTFCLGLGAPGLALLAFSAATLLPLGSEWLLIILLTARPHVADQVQLVLLATVANTAGGLLNYGLAYAGIGLVKKSPLDQRPRLTSMVRRYGNRAMLLAWTPWIGDPLTVLAGIFRLPVGPFLGYSCLGRLARYLVCWLGVLGAS